MNVMIWRYCAVLAVVTVPFAACGGDGGEKEKVQEGAEPAVLGQAREQIDPADVPAYLDARVGRLKLEGVQIQKQGDRAATLRGRVRASLALNPKPDKAAFLRVVPPAGGSISITRNVEAELIEEEGEWRVVDPDDGVDFETPDAAVIPPAAREEARKVAVGAMSALLDYDGDIEAYNRAQVRFYATKAATEADFNQPGFDPPPVLARRSERPIDENELSPVSGAVWRRTNDGGEDDVFLADALPFTGSKPGGFTCPSGFDLKSIKARTVAGQPTGEQVGDVQQSVTIDGQAVVRAGNWTCSGLGADERTRTVGPRDTRVDYRATVSRLGLGKREWFISTLNVDVSIPVGRNINRSGAGQIYSTGT